MTPKLKAIERFGHYMKIMPVNTGLSVHQEIEFAKDCATSEAKQVLNSFNKDYPYSIKTKDMEWTSDDSLLFDLYKKYWSKVILELGVLV